MQWLVAARRELLSSPPDPQQPALLLEGSWPAGSTPASHHCLDDRIDARFAWIDAEASRLAEHVAELVGTAGPACMPEASPAYLSALGLRYYLLKLVRAVVYFTEVRPPSPSDTIRAVLRQNRDEDYADVIQQIAKLAGAECHVHWTGRSEALTESAPRAEPWRRWLDLLRRPLEPRADWSDPRRRVFLCGNPRILEPVCRELLDQGCAVWWLYDRLAMKAWLRWRRLGVGQLVCNSDLGRESHFRPAAVEFCAYRGVELSGSVERWIAKRLEVHGARQSRLLEQMDWHFGRIRPDALVLDEDATPAARAVVAVARRHHVASLVVQHGAPACRFGFAPPVADRLLVWGASSQRQLEEWGVAPERIRVTGSPFHDQLFQGLSKRRQETTDHSGTRPVEILLLATTPPRDERPDSIVCHLTQSTYAGMLRAALGAVAGLPSARLVVKLHPRSPGDPIVRAVVAEYPSVEVTLVESGPLELLLATADCVLSCISSAGIDAALAGIPVVQILPAGCGDVLPFNQWGLFGSATTQEELTRVLCHAISVGRMVDIRPNPGVFGNRDTSAAANVADAVLSAAEPKPSIHRRMAALGLHRAPGQHGTMKQASRG
ncbi:MAG: hypothetical protein HUU20_20540 [Pirellulales bacterium]|nr:hypothetical protein [Pirellulales bacterium]